MLNQKFYPQEKLKSKTQIRLLFEQGQWTSCGNLRVIARAVDEGEQPKVGVSVSKKYFKRAVDRNRIKRLLRECYRRHKAAYRDQFGHHAHTMLFWTSYEMPQNYQEMERTFLKLCSE
ncbi:ribonuclease P protein component [Riemerella columbina]|uniref:ribonuclease P protein component n=1 Tax=Riemerella columbina TaxID=103810 RepID=UPI00266FFA68|nr:ribonuclease P protein component [Riemerella columbina]WKS95421.1 ribonuclease P protein component [Riemerella columbina]